MPIQLRGRLQGKKKRSPKWVLTTHITIFLVMPQAAWGQPLSPTYRLTFWPLKVSLFVFAASQNPFRGSDNTHNHMSSHATGSWGQASFALGSSQHCDLCSSIVNST